MRDNVAPMQRRATQKEVALLAGVSRSVVSHVLHGGSESIGVSSETSERVKLAAVQLGYRPSAIARILKGRGTKLIAVVHGDGYPRLRFNDESLYFGELMNGFVDAAFRQGYSVTLCPQLLSDTPEDKMADARFDGLLWYSTVPSEPNDLRLQECSLPLVIMHAHLEDFQGKYDTVRCDNEGAIAIAIRHLVDLGHKSVAYAFDSHYSFGEAKIRQDTFREKGNMYGLRLTEVDIRNDGPGLIDLMNQECPPTGFVAYNDALAARVVDLLSRLHIRVPQDASVIGFDSTSFCDRHNPPLTSVSQPISKMAEYAVEALIQRIDGLGGDPTEKVFECGLDIRSSTGLASIGEGCG